MFKAIIDLREFSRKLKEGDPEAHLLVWYEVRKVIIPFLKGKGFSHEDAEDICEDTWFKLSISNFTTYDPEKGSLATWIKAVAWRVALDKAEAEQLWQKVPLEDLEYILDKDPPVEEKGGRQQELASLVEQAKAPLTQRDRTILALVFEDGLTDKQIAEKQAISESAARKRSYRARIRIRNELERLNICELRRRNKRIGGPGSP